MNKHNVIELLETVLNQAVKLVEASTGRIVLFNEERTEQIPVVAIGEDKDFLGQRHSIHEGIAGRVWETGGLVVINPPLPVGKGKEQAGYAWVGVPLRHGVNLAGVISLRHRRRGDWFTAEDETTVKQLADLASAAYESAALKENEEKYRNIVEHTQDPIFMIRDGKYSFVNAAMGRLFGLSRRELEGADMTLFLHPDCRETVLANHAARLKGLPVPDAYEVKVINQQGEECTGELKAQCIMINGEPVILGIAKDITQEKRVSRVQQALYRISETAGAACDLDELYRVVHSIIRELIPADHFYIALYDEAANCLDFPYHADTRDSWERYRPFGQGLTEYIIRSGETLNWDEGKKKELLEQGVIASTDLLPLSCLGIPLKGSDNRVFGAMGVQIYAGQSRYSEADQDMMVAISRQVAMAIERRRALDGLRESEEKYRVIVENTTDAVFMVKDGRYLFGNDAMARMLGVDRQELIGREVGRSVHPGDLEWFAANYQRYFNGEKALEAYELRVFDAQGRVRHWEVNVRPVIVGGARAVQGLARDITERRRAIKLQNALYRISEATSTTASLENLYRAVHRIIGELIPADNFYIALCDKAEKSVEFPYFVDTMQVSPQRRRMRQGVTEYVLRQGKPVCLTGEELHLLQKAKEIAYGKTGGKADAPLHWMGAPLKGVDGDSFGVLAVQIYEGNDRYEENDMDILSVVSGQVALAIQRKQAEEKLRFVSLHDALTGLFNRAYFETELQRINDSREGGAAVIVCDVDGLKLVNDTLGHIAGDEVLTAVGEILRKSVRQADVVARIGGDEFAVLLREGEREVVDAVCRRIRQEIRHCNRRQRSIPVSLSVGYSLRVQRPLDTREIFREADNHMYQEKLTRSQDARSSIVQTAIKMLEMRDFLTAGHGERLKELTTRLARHLEMPDPRISELRLLAQFHDIGKVGIPNQILFKTGRLTVAEKKEIQRHCEIGHRLALSSEDIAPLADWILKHQEWWNGEGYPLGIHGEDIPLECRILALADAYDAMTTDRPYRQAMAKEAAVNELRRCAGSQFDPTLVEPFIQSL